nr:replication protein A 70 kDa DNA-binding subunit B-like [Ipomoea batatas]
MNVDIIGRVVEICSPVEKVIAGKQSRLMDFLLEDSEQRQLKCTIWDDHVEAMLPYFNSTDQEPIAKVGDAPLPTDGDRSAQNLLWGTERDCLQYLKS